MTAGEMRAPGSKGTPSCSGIDHMTITCQGQSHDNHMLSDSPLSTVGWC